MKRRKFIALMGGVAAAWPLTVHAQQADRVRRIGVLMGYGENDPEGKARLSGFTQGLAALGWTDGRNVRMDVRWAAADNVDRMRMVAKGLVDLQPEVILASNTPVTAALQRETRTIPIVFAAVSDPVGEGFVAVLPRPGGNLTGFINMEAGMVGKWLELLTEIAPAIKRAAIMFNPDTSPDRGLYFLPLFVAAAQSLKVAPIAAPVHSAAEIETVIASLGREPGGGLVVPPDTFTLIHRAPIILLSARNNVPAVYGVSVYSRDGGLLSYEPDIVDIYRRSASYVDRILRGAKPADLPVQLPVKFEMALNTKTAKALGLAVPQAILHLAEGDRIRNFATQNKLAADGRNRSRLCENSDATFSHSLGHFPPPTFVAGGDRCSSETGRRGGQPWLRPRARTRSFSPLSGAREIGITFNPELPAGRAEVL